MPNADRVLKILLALSADRTGGKEVREELKGIRDEAKKTQEASKKQGDEAVKTAQQSVQGIKKALGAGAVIGAALAAPINKLADDIARATDEQKRMTAELSEQIPKWNELARNAKDMGDVAKLGLDMAPALAKAQAQLNAFRANELTLWQRFVDAMPLTKMLAGGKGVYEQLSEDMRKAAELAANTTLFGAIAARKEAERFSEEFQQMKLAPSEGLEKVNRGIEELIAKRERLRKLETEAKNFDDRNSAFQEIAKVNVQLAEQEGRREQLLALEKKQNDEADRVDKAAKEKALNDQLERQRLLMNDIQGHRAAIESDPFALTADQRAQLIPVLQQEAAALRAAGDAWGALRVEQELATLSFAGEFQAGLVQWANSFGTAAQQSANLITGTLNNAIQQTSQLLTDAIFRTGDWEEAILSLGESFVQQLIQMGLQMLVQHALGESLKAQSTATSAAQGATIAAAHAPAAAATSISTGGSAAVIGGIAAAAAIALIIGLLAGGGFRRGGFTGRGRDDEIAGVVHKNEVVIPAAKVRQAGGPQRVIKGFADGTDDPWTEPGNPIPFTWDVRSPYWPDEARGVWSPQGSGTWVSGGAGFTYPGASGSAGWSGTRPRQGPPSVTIGSGGPGVFVNHPPSSGGIQVSPSGGNPRMNTGDRFIENWAAGLGAGPAWAVGAPAGSNFWGSFNNGATTEIPTYWGPSNGTQGVWREAGSGSFGGFGNSGGIAGLGFQGSNTFGSMASSSFGGYLNAAQAQRFRTGAFTSTFADGVRLPGPASMTDTIPAMLAKGEVVISAPDVEYWDRRLGSGFLDGIRDRRLTVGGMAAGGRTSSSMSGSGSGGMGGVRIINVTNAQDAMKEAMKSFDGQTIIVDTINGRRMDV